MVEPTLSAHIRSGAAAHDGCPLVFASPEARTAGPARTPSGKVRKDVLRAARRAEAGC